MLKFLTLGAALLSAVAISSPSLAAASPDAWVDIVTVDSTTIRFDMASLKTSGKIVEATLKTDVRRTQKTDSGKRFKTGLSASRFDCDKEQLQEGKTEYYDDRGRPVDETTDAEWRKVTSGTVPYRMLAVVCAVAFAPQTDGIAGLDWRGVPSWTTADYEITAAMDVIQDMGRDRISVMILTTFKEWQFVGKRPYHFRLDQYLLDCRGRQEAPLASTYFVTPTRYVQKDFASSPQSIKVAAIGTSSLFYRTIDALCSAPRIPYRETASQDEAAGVSLGTAWATNKGYLVTASHVVTGGRKIELYQDGKNVGVAELVANDQANDVAVLKYIPNGGAKLKMIPLSERPGALGRSVFTLGFPEPDVMGQKIKLSRGDISSMAGIQDDARFLQISIPIQQGNSGGPVVGPDGAALGVVSSKLARFSDEKDALRPENVNYAVKVSYVKPLLEELPDLADYVAIKPTAGTSQEDLVAQVSQAVYMVVVSP